MAKDKDKDKKKKDNSRTFEVGGNVPGTVAIAPPGNWSQGAGGTLTAAQVGLAPPIHGGGVQPSGPKGTYGGSQTTSTLNINPVTGGLITTVSPLGTSKVLEDKIKAENDRKYSDDPVLAFQQKEADRAREEEKKRQERIAKGMEKIDASFAGFDDAYYKNYQNTYINHYMPELDDKFAKAKEALTFALARAGTLDSTARDIKTEENQTYYNRNKDRIQAEAVSAGNTMQDKIAAERSALIASLNANARANEIGNEATNKTNALMSQAPPYQAGPDIFFGAAQGVGGVVQAAQNAQYANAFNGVGGSPGTGVRTGGTSVYG